MNLGGIMGRGRPRPHIQCASKENRPVIQSLGMQQRVDVSVPSIIGILTSGYSVARMHVRISPLPIGSVVRFLETVGGPSYPHVLVSLRYLSHHSLDGLRRV